MPSRQEAEKAVKTLLEYINPHCNDEVFCNTPSRVVDSFSELFSGYQESADEELSKSFENNYKYNEIVLIDNIRFSSTCEHHMLPFKGFANVAYIPNKKIVGLSKICRVVDVFARRLQLQERMTHEIAEVIWRYLEPIGVAVHVRAEHDCMCIRGVTKPGAKTTTLSFKGAFLDDINKQKTFLSLVNSQNAHI